MRNSGLVKNDIQNVLKALKKVAGVDAQNFTEEVGGIDTSDVGAISYSFVMHFKMTTPPDNTLPLIPIDVRLEMEVNEDLRSTDETLGGNYVMQLHITGQEGEKQYMCSWHLDLDSRTDRRYIHPRYHLTYGGKNMRDELKQDKEYFGKLMLMATPRIPMAPLDGILAIDFVLNHFYKNDIINDVLNDSRYKEAVRASQTRIWGPYYRSIYEHFSGGALASKGVQYVPNLK